MRRSKSGLALRKKPEWDFGYKDPAVYKLSKQEMAVKKAMMVSKNREKAAQEWRSLEKKLRQNVVDQQTSKIYDAVKCSKKNKTMNLSQFVRKQREEKQLNRSRQRAISKQDKPKNFYDKLSGSQDPLTSIYKRVVKDQNVQEKIRKEQFKEIVNKYNHFDESISELKSTVFQAIVHQDKMQSCQPSPSKEILKPVIGRAKVSQEPVPVIAKEQNREEKIKDTQSKLLKLKQLLHQKEMMLATKSAPKKDKKDVPVFQAKIKENQPMHMLMHLDEQISFQLTDQQQQKSIRKSYMPYQKQYLDESRPQHPKPQRKQPFLIQQAHSMHQQQQIQQTKPVIELSLMEELRLMVQQTSARIERFQPADDKKKAKQNSGALGNKAAGRASKGSLNIFRHI